MTFEWDEAKNRSNVEKHGISFEEVTPLFATDYALGYDDAHYEDRFIAVGRVGGRLVVVVFTEPATETVRIVSARRANRREARSYRAYKADQEP